MITKPGTYFIDNGVYFCVWAPFCNKMNLKLYNTTLQQEIFSMNRNGDFFSIFIKKDTKSNIDYLYILDEEKERPDPRSQCQPYGVMRESRLYNHTKFIWSDLNWKGIPFENYIIYKLHTGTFSSTSDFEGIQKKLSYFTELGITAVELMPVSSFSGERNWGYDGVYPFAPQQSYGGPDGLKRLINEAHSCGIAVIMDVVYNHFGPEGNFLSDFGPYFTDRYHTPWGSALNFDGSNSDEVRRYVIDNALMWLKDYHIDALRLDAVHSIFDFGAYHILEELADMFHKEAEQLGRKAYLIAESDLNDPRIIKPKEIGGYGIDAQWNDEFHHSLMAFMTKKSYGYFVDYGKLEHFAKTVSEGFVLDGKYSSYRKRRHGCSSKNISGNKFVVFTQNHDQIANASQGKRSGVILSRQEDAVCALLLLLSPYIPLLFMGQEYGEIAPFYYFISHSDTELCRRVSEGRKREDSMFADISGSYQNDFADPASEDTFNLSKLQWMRLETKEHKKMFELYKKIINIRKQYPALYNCRKDLTKTFYNEDEKWIMILRNDENNNEVLIGACFNDRKTIIELPDDMKQNWNIIFSTSSDVLLNTGANSSILCIPAKTAVVGI